MHKQTIKFEANDSRALCYI